jgi:uncharacterized protein (TIGR00255 family)
MGEVTGASIQESAGPADASQSASQLPVQSMTGYARVCARDGDAPLLTLTLKSINHRFLDLQLRLPAGADALESVIRTTLKRELTRGHVECTLTVDRLSRRDTQERKNAPVQFDMNALTAYVQNFRAAAQTLGVASEPDLNVAAQLPGMLVADPGVDLGADLAADVETREGVDKEEQARLERQALPLLAEAILALRTMRAREGAALAGILRESLDRLSQLAIEVAALRGTVQAAQFARIAQRLDALVGGAFDRDRVLAEAALLAERGDVEEEVARMHTHIEHFHALLNAGGEAGKKLDFLSQEMNREANTLLSKTGGLTAGGARITECGLAMKAEVEKLREQVQNLE